MTEHEVLLRVQGQVARLEAENARLREALAVYAEVTNWSDEFPFRQVSWEGDKRRGWELAHEALRGAA